MSKNTVLLEHHLKTLKLPTMLREYAKVAATCAKQNVAHAGFLTQLTELELIERERRAGEWRLKAARFPAHKTLDGFDFAAQPSINKTLVSELARSLYLDHRENILLVGSPGTGKTHLATALGVEACTRGKKVRFYRVTELITQMMEAREERALARLKRRARDTVIQALHFCPAGRCIFRPSFTLPIGVELTHNLFGRRRCRRLICRHGWFRVGVRHG